MPSQKCQACNNITTDDSGQCHLHLPGAGQPTTDAIVSPEPSRAAGLNIRQAGRRLARNGLALLICGCLAAACAPPGHFPATALQRMPAATLLYPGSDGVVRTQTNGTAKLVLRRGDPATVRLSATTTASASEVLAYFSTNLGTEGWAQTSDDPNNTNVPCRRTHVVGWTRGKVGFELDVWNDAATNEVHYQTTLSG